MKQTPEFNRHRHNKLICCDCNERHAEIGSIACSHCNNKTNKMVLEKVSKEAKLQQRIASLEETLAIAMGDIVYLTHERADKDRFGDTIHAIETLLNKKDTHDK